MALLVPAVLAGLVALVFAGHAFVNYDTAYALLWGQELAAGRAPDVEFTLAPTPKPLLEVAGMVLRPGGAEVLSFVWLGVAGTLVLALGRAWFGLAAGIAAAALFLTREPVLSFGLRAYADLPYLCLVLGALLVEARRPRAGWPVLALLAVAGLLRPEAWLLSFAYCGWLAWRRELDPRLVALAVAGPVLWALHDLLVTGDPLFSLTGTQDNAEVLGRRTGPVDLVLYGPLRLGEVVREPVLAGLVAGAVLAWRRARWEPLIALGAALGAFAVLAVAGLPIITRYLLLPGALACVLCGGALAAGLRDRAWRPVSAVLLVLVVVFAPGQVDRLDRLERSLGIQERILADLEALPAGALACRPLAVTNRRPVPHLALRSEDLDPGAVLVGLERRPCTYVAPADAEVARRFVFDRRDEDRRLPPVPPGFERVAGNASWTVFRARR